MSRKKTSQQWIQAHVTDPYVKQAQREGYRSRAVYKLSDLDGRFHLFRPGMVVLDLGAAPGGWSQWVRERVMPGGRVIALDLLPIMPLDGVEVIEGDFTAPGVLDTLYERVEGRPIDWVLSDMLPNLSGIPSVDQPRAMALAELAMMCALKVLCSGGGFVVKLFHGEGFDEYIRLARGHFLKVRLVKPKASRAHSREVYLMGRGLK